MNVCKNLHSKKNTIYLILIGIIQLWRRVTDSSLIDECTDDVVIDNTNVKGTTGICFERARSRK
jgi:hypothetical protein